MHRIVALALYMLVYSLCRNNQVKRLLIHNNVFHNLFSTRLLTS